MAVSELTHRRVSPSSVRLTALGQADSADDNWVARDMNGTALENAPFESVFRDMQSQHRFAAHRSPHPCLPCLRLVTYAFCGMARTARVMLRLGHLID